jgi:hypothetical protein
MATSNWAAVPHGFWWCTNSNSIEIRIFNLMNINFLSFTDVLIDRSESGCNSIGLEWALVIFVI